MDPSEQRNQCSDATVNCMGSIRKRQLTPQRKCIWPKIIRVHSHRAKSNAKANFFFDLCRYSMWTANWIFWEPISRRRHFGHGNELFKIMKMQWFSKIYAAEVVNWISNNRVATRQGKVREFWIMSGTFGHLTHVREFLSCHIRELLGNFVMTFF